MNVEYMCMIEIDRSIDKFAAKTDVWCPKLSVRSVRISFKKKKKKDVYDETKSLFQCVIYICTCISDNDVLKQIRVCHLFLSLSLSLSLEDFSKNKKRCQI
jgi:hypothetical protein